MLKWTCMSNMAQILIRFWSKPWGSIQNISGKISSRVEEPKECLYCAASQVGGGLETSGVYSHCVGLVVERHRWATMYGNKNEIGVLFTSQQLQSRTTRSSDRCTPQASVGVGCCIRSRGGSCWWCENMWSGWGWWHKMVLCDEWNGVFYFYCVTRCFEHSITSNRSFSRFRSTAETVDASFWMDSTSTFFINRYC